MTAFNSKSGGFQLTTVGRVQTPTLAILVEREEKIRAFVPRNYWEVSRHVPRERRRVHRPLVRRDSGRRTTTTPTRAPSGSGTRRARTRSVAKCTGKPGIVTEETKPTTQGAPLLYDLTSLQREANGRFGFSARTTLSLAQALYEKHKVLTYPRTDSRALPEDYIGTVKATMEALAETNAYGGFARRDAEAEMGEAQQAHLRQREDLRPLRDHPDARAAEAPERARGEALRPRRQALPRGVLSGGRIPGDDAHHARRGRAVQDRGQGAGEPGLARRLWQGSAGRRRRRSRRSQPSETVATEKVEVVPRVHAAAAAAAPRRRCSPRWKARAS